MNATTEENLQTDVAKVLPGPVLLLAGPGTGKTYQLARRVKWLVEERDVSPDEITVITFTDEAMRNMRERMSDPASEAVYVPDDRQPSRVSTMHSLGYQVVREHHQLLGFTDPPSVLPPYLVEVILGDAANLLGLPRHVGEEQAAECRGKGRCDPSDTRDECRICQRYSDILCANNALDYDHQIFLACKLLRENNTILSPCQAAATHLLVDEYQDINPAQFELIQLIAAANPTGLYAVGDDNQSIYRFRGGTPYYIRNFRQHWAGSTILQLGHSYRCPQAVLDAAAAVITGGCTDVLNDPKTLTGKQADKLVTIHEVGSPRHEVTHIAGKLSETRGPRDALILVPGMRYAAPLKRALRQRAVTYDCRSDVEKTGWHMLNQLARWLDDDTDNFSLRLLLDQIVCKADLQAELDHPSEEDLERWRDEALLRISRLWETVENSRWHLYTALKRKAPASCLEPVLAKIQELRALKPGKAKPMMPPHEILGAATRTLRPWPDSRQLMSELTEWVDDSRSRDRARGRPAARVLTMQSAKGLEADIVFIVGLEEGSFPYPNKEGEDLEEQYRLLYVSMTRAKQELHLYYARTRRGDVSYRPRSPGEPYGQPNPAKFLGWLPEHAVTCLQHWHASPRRKRASKPAAE